VHPPPDPPQDRVAQAVRDLLERAWSALKGLVVALLPYPENQRLASAWGVDAGPSSALLGVIESTVGLGLFFFGAVEAVEGGSLLLSGLLLENWSPELSTQHFQGGGLIALMTWLIHPLAWLFMLIAVTGAVRIAAYVASQQAVGEPLLWLVLRTTQALARLATAAKRSRDLGPLRPDRQGRGAGCDLEIVTCRERPEWTDGTTLEIEGRFFRPIAAGQEVADGPHWAIAYRFRELEPNAVIRGLVHYRDTVVPASPADDQEAP